MLNSDFKISNLINLKADWWSLGIMMIEMINCCQNPYRSGEESPAIYFDRAGMKGRDYEIHENQEWQTHPQSFIKSPQKYIDDLKAKFSKSCDYTTLDIIHKLLKFDQTTHTFARGNFS